MKGFVALLTALTLSYATASAAPESRLEFVGVMQAGGQVRVALTDRTDNTTHWLTSGESFQGYTLRAYEKDTESVVLSREGRNLRLTLVSGKVKAGASLNGAFTPETIKKIAFNLRQIAAAADRYFLEKGRNATTLDRLVGPSSYIQHLIPVTGEDYGTEITQGGPVTASLGGETVSYQDDVIKAGAWEFRFVQRGDSAAKLARTTNSSPQDLAKLNEDTQMDRLRVGEVVRTK